MNRLMVSLLTAYAPWWWVGPSLMAFCWLVVPAMRMKHDVLRVDDFSRAARFWWFSSWVPLGVSGLGLGLGAMPLLAQPWVSGIDAPDAWFGMRLTLTALQCQWAFMVGAGLVVAGVKWAAIAWMRQRQISLLAWRFKMRNRL